MDYFVRMEATTDTYLYHIACVNENWIEYKTLTFSDIRKLHPGTVKNNVDALLAAQEHAKEMFELNVDSEN